MIWILWIALVFQALLIKSKAQRYCCAVFVSEAIIHHIFFSNYGDNGFLYFSTAALGNLLVAILLMGLRPIIKMVLIIQAACLLGAVLNFGGYLLWVNYYSVTPYNVAFYALYFFVFACNLPCLSGGLNDDRDPSNLDAAKISYFCLDYRSFIKNLIRVLQ